MHATVHTSSRLVAWGLESLKYEGGNGVAATLEALEHIRR